MTPTPVTIPDPTPNPTPDPIRTRSWLATIVKLRCNRCRVGALFPHGTFAFVEPFEMHRACPRCGLDYWPEPGFYYGAMFLSYILFCFPFLGLVIFLHWVVGWSLGTSMLVLCLLATISFVYVFRVARSAWLALNVKYDPELSERVYREVLAQAATEGKAKL